MTGSDPSSDRVALALFGAEGSIIAAMLAFLDPAATSFRTRASLVVAVIANLFAKDPPIVGNTIGSSVFNSGNTYPST